MSKRIVDSLGKWKGGFLHERTVITSLVFLLVVLTVDGFVRKLPISGYGLVLVTLVTIALTTWATCHGIKWAITSNKSLAQYLEERSPNEKWVRLIKGYDSDLFGRVFHSNGTSFDSLEYPTKLNEQIRLLLKDIERDFVKTWYSDISQNPSFLFDSHLILEEILFKMFKRLKTVQVKTLLLTILTLYLNHLQEFKKAIKKLARLKADDGDGEQTACLPDVYRYTHPGSQSDPILNFYLKKVTKVVLKEFSPYDFANSLECKILSGIIGRKVFRKLLLTLEDPTWINLKLIYLLDSQKHEGLVGGKAYLVREKAPTQEESQYQFNRGGSSLTKRYLAANIFESGKNLFERNGFGDGGNTKVEPGEGQQQQTTTTKKTVEKKQLSLPLAASNGEDTKGNISTVLSGLISSTAGPLLPDNISVHYQALNKMWQSPVAEVKDISESITNSLRKVFMNGTKDKARGFSRSKSTESLTVPVEPGLKVRDISVGEELCESMRFGSPPPAVEAVLPRPKIVKKLTKTQSFDNDSLTLDDDDDGGIDVVDETDGQKVDSGTEREGPDVGLKPADHRRDVSPVYEEPEDFATTIAKLRSLLQQRESSSTLSDKSNVSLDSQTADKSHSSNKSQSLEGDPFDSQTACDIPTDGRLFINISIPSAELLTESGSTHVVYSIQYDGIYMLKQEHGVTSESELVLQTTVVKRKFMDFVQLQAKLEENGNLRPAMKGVKGPMKWLNSHLIGKSDDASGSRKAMLESFLRQICGKVEISTSTELHEFLGYGQTGNDALVKKVTEPSIQRIDKLLANKVTGVFNSIKTVLPFDFDSTAFIATNDSVKGIQEQKLLQGFFNFGNKPESFELHLNFIAKEPTGESMSDDIRHYFSQKSDCIEDAVDVLDSSEWLTEQRECRFISPEETCVWHNYRDSMLDDEPDTIDSTMPIYSLVIDILSELFEDSDSWVVKEPVIRLIKVVSGHWEARLESDLSTLDWDKIFGNVIRLLRSVAFQSSPRDGTEVNADEIRAALKDIILNSVPGWMGEFVKPEGLSSAVTLFLDSFQHFRLNRDFVLRLMDILLVNLLSCHHLVGNST